MKTGVCMHLYNKKFYVEIKMIPINWRLLDEHV